MQYAPTPVRRTLQPSSSPYMPYACCAQHAMNIHDIDRQRLALGGGVETGVVHINYAET